MTKRRILRLDSAVLAAVLGLRGSTGGGLATRLAGLTGAIDGAGGIVGGGVRGNARWD